MTTEAYAYLEEYIFDMRCLRSAFENTFTYFVGTTTPTSSSCALAIIGIQAKSSTTPANVLPYFVSSNHAAGRTRVDYKTYCALRIRRAETERTAPS